MSLELFALSVLVAMIVIAAFLPISLGVMGFVAALFVGFVMGGMSFEDIFGVFPGQLFIILAGVTYLFAIVQNNGTLDLLTNWGLHLVRGNLGLAPWVMFALSTLLTSAGAFGPASVAILAAPALQFAARYNISPLLMGIMVIQGSTAGSYSPINPVGVVVSGVLSSRDLPQAPVQLFVNALIFSTLCLVPVFLFFGGLRLLKRRVDTQAARVEARANGNTTNENTEPEGGTERHNDGLTWYKGATLTGLVLLLVLVLVFRVDVGFAAFAVGLALALMAPREQAGVLASMPWSVILLITGIVTYVGVLEEIGTVDYMSQLISAVGSPIIATLVASYIGGILSSFASTTAIIAASLPLAAPILQDPSISAIGVISAIALSSIVVDVSPFSTNGALLLANRRGVEERVFYRQLLLFGAVVVAVGPGLAWLIFVAVPAL